MGAGTAWSQPLPCQIRWRATASSCCPFKTPEAPPSTEQVSLQPELPRPSTATLYFYGLFSQQQATLGKVSQRQQGLGWGVT